MHIFIWALLASFFLNTPLKAQEKPEFGLPIDCTLGKDCWVLNYVDMGPDDNNQTDPYCYARTYDGHKGTDFAILDKATMNDGIAVLAAKAGTVERIRDGEPDRFPTDQDLEQSKLDRKECGNAVLIDHSDGLQTLYCHLKKDSVKVAIGDKVEKGDKIGEVGLSGYTQFPHVHFGVLWEGAVVDPFTGLNNTDSCGSFKRHLWDPDLNMEYQPASLYHGGFSDSVPDLDAIDRSTQQTPKELKVTAPALVFWFAMFGAREHDQIVMTITDPQGRTVAKREIAQPKTRARQFYYTGRKFDDLDLIPGEYKGNVQVKRTDNNNKEKQWELNRIIQVVE